MEDGVTIVLEVEDIFECFILGSGVRKTFGSEEAGVFFITGKAFNDDTLSVSEQIVVLVFGHIDMLIKI